MQRDMQCDLCEAARITPWFYEDDLCWIAECEICAVPMVVWRNHDNAPADDVKAALDGNLCRCGTHQRILRAVMRAKTQAKEAKT